MAITDIVTVGGSDSLVEAGLLGRDCAMPITRIEKRLMQDEVLRNMPVFFGYWENGTVVPMILGQAIDIDTTVIEDEDCDVAVVDADLTEGELVAPNMRLITLATKVLKIDELIPAFCKQRRIARRELGLILNSDGTIDDGNEYAVDFARFALATVSNAMSQLLAQRIMRGDESETYGFDGLYTQLTNGWEQGSPTVPTYLNQAVTIDWGDLTDSAGATTPDDLTADGKTLSLWGTTVDVPEGINLAQLIEDYLIPAVEANWTDAEGGIDTWEFHVPSGTKRCMINTAACIKPCEGMSIYFDSDMRERFTNLRARDIVRLFPSGREIPMLESPQIEENVMWLGPRSIGGAPTYGVSFQNMNELFNAVGVLGDTYGQGNGLFDADEPLLEDTRMGLPFEANAVQQDVRKVSINCVQASLMVKVGVLAVARHMFFRIENVTCGTWVADVKSKVTIDGQDIEGEAPAAPALSAPANNSSGTDTTPDLTWAAVTNPEDVTYDIQIATDVGFSTIVVDVTGHATTTYTPSALAEDEYWWRVRAVDVDAAGPWSTVRKFTITS